MQKISTMFVSTCSKSPFQVPTQARTCLGALALVLALTGHGQAQNFTKADSGWVRLFNGTDFTGIYGRLYSQPVTETPDASWTILFPGTDTANIHGSSTGRQGNIGTKKNYSHYRMRVEYRHAQAGGGNNAGITYHTDESVPRMNNNWPRSIECQMKQDETGSAFSIQQLAFDSRASSKAGGSNWVATGGTAITGCETGCDGRNYKGNPLIRGGTQWNRMEIIIRGSDSAIHKVNDTVVFKLWNMRIRSTSGQDQAAVTSGGIGLQAEGALIYYRRWEIMELPAGTPAPHILNRFFVTSPDSGVTLAPGGTHKITWKSIGSAGKVSLQYNTGTGGWKPVTADSVPNTGSYDWLVPAENTQTLRVRVSGPAWTIADSSSGNNRIGGGSGIRAAGWLRGAGQESGSISVVGLVAKSGQILEIRDLHGRIVRSVRLEGMGDSFVPTWNGRDGHGRAATPGIYFARLSGAPGAVARLLVH